VASWRTICPGMVRMFDPVGTEEKHGFDTATSEAFDTFQSILKIRMLTVQVNGIDMAWVCENFFGTEPNVQSAYSIETFSWDDAGDLLIKTYCPMPETVGADSDPYAHLLEGQQSAGWRCFTAQAHSRSHFVRWGRRPWERRVRPRELQSDHHGPPMTAAPVGAPCRSVRGTFRGLES